MESKYAYSPISSPRSTRILILMPHVKRDAPLRCSIEEISLDDKLQRYNALSYVWRATTGTRPLLCDDKVILITPNCESALRRLRKPWKRIALWVDAIVINQEDLSERAHQVSLMPDIYGGASKVIIWLGESTTQIERMFSQMNIYHLIFRSKWDRFPLAKKRSLSILLGRFSTQNIETIFNNDWATRMWTFQELVLAANPIVVYGSSRMTWELFLGHLLGLEQRQLYLDENHHDFEPAKSRWMQRKIITLLNTNDLRKFWSEGLEAQKRKAQGIILSVCMYMAQLNSCSDTRDKIYGLYGILNIAFDNLPAVDYTKPVSAVFEDFTRMTIQSTEKFWLAWQYEWRVEPASTLPSWVLDLTTGYRMVSNDLSLLESIIDSGLAAEGSATCNSKISLDPGPNPKPGSLALKGMIYGNIVETVRRWPTYGTKMPLGSSCLGSWVIFCANYKLSEDSPTSFPFGPLAVLRELIVYRGDLDDREFLRTRFDRMLTGLDNFSMEAWKDHCKAKKGQIIDFLHYVNPELSESLLFTISSGLIGITTAYIEPGDTIALLTGSDRPVILRRQEDNWRCIGSAHIEGIRHGEVWPLDPSPDRLETLVLI